MSEQAEALNWVDPDAIARDGYVESASTWNERRYSRFFAETIHEPRFDELREVWEGSLSDPDHIGQMHAKRAFWAVARMRFPDVDALVTIEDIPLSIELDCRQL